MMEDMSPYAPSKGNSSGGHFLGLGNMSGSASRRRQPVSTRASDPMGKVVFPTDQGDGDIEELNDISGIVQDISNIEDTSFAIAIDSFNTKIGQSNTNGRLLPSNQSNNFIFSTIHGAVAAIRGLGPDEFL